MVTATVENPYGPVGKWILGTAGLVGGMIHVGGVNHLTQSGLSMTTWSPQGSLPPITRANWEEEFARYKNFPEWQQRKSMTLDDSGLSTDEDTVTGW
jgi:cytochrome c oxidase assembly protein subunit 15